jgi:hypothetical protein
MAWAGLPAHPVAVQDEKIKTDPPPALYTGWAYSQRESGEDFGILKQYKFVWDYRYSHSESYHRTIVRFGVYYPDHLYFMESNDPTRRMTKCSDQSWRSSF